jgi:hypothetical protein
MPCRMTRLAPVLLALMAFAVGSCDADDDASSQAPSREEFADRANEICRDAKRSLDDVAEGADGPEDIVQAIDEVIAESRETVSELSDLERPEGDAGERAERFVDVTRTEIEEAGIPALEDLREAVESEDRQAIQRAAGRLQEIDSSASTRAARAVGARACGDGS